MGDMSPIATKYDLKGNSPIIVVEAMVTALNFIG